MREQVRRWREDLISLTRRNRLLYFQHTKTSTLEILEPGPSAIMAGLPESGKRGWRFCLPPESEEPDELDAGPKPPPKRKPDELLTTKDDRESLESSLRALERRATQEFIDKGLSVLYLGIGMLKWIDPDLEERVESPLLLVPVALHRENPRAPFELRRADEDPVINPALTVKFTRLGVELPSIDDGDEEDPDTVLASVARKIQRESAWAVVSRVVLGIFSFHKEVMYRDLLDHEGVVIQHPAVRGLALGSDADVDLTFDPVPEERLDEELPPERMVSILDTDSTQRQCIAAARAGKSFLMDGPPGTGKSQTISNIIAELITQGKTVLFVSEKAAALEVVKRRLDEAGLGEYLLELHSHKATRKEVAQELGRALMTRPRPRRGLSRAELDALVERRRELSAHARAVNEVREPLGQSLHDVLGIIATLHRLPEAPVATSIDASLRPETMNRLLDLAAKMSRSWGPVERRDDFFWRGLRGVEYDSVLASELREEIEHARPPSSRWNSGRVSSRTISLSTGHALCSRVKSSRISLRSSQSGPPMSPPRGSSRTACRPPRSWRASFRRRRNSTGGAQCSWTGTLDLDGGISTHPCIPF